MADLQMQATAPFDVLADTYDEVFTRSLLGKAQRAQVWRVLVQAYSTGQRVLEINCGTGEDALFLARRGIAAVACDRERPLKHQEQKSNFAYCLRNS
jgi:ubiquinone/menaquinone biosynthesis C-methylase UbiE